MTFGQSVSTCFSKYATFNGRASRSEYWWWILFNYIVIFVAALIGGFISYITNSDIGIAFYGFAILALFIPSISVLVRRLHDTDHSGWYYWISLIPLIGGIWLLVLLCTASDSDENSYGLPENYQSGPPEYSYQ